MVGWKSPQPMLDGKMNTSLVYGEHKSCRLAGNNGGVDTTCVRGVSGILGIPSDNLTGAGVRMGLQCMAGLGHPHGWMAQLTIAHEMPFDSAPGHPLTQPQHTMKGKKQ